jgi:cardiolipin synthase
MKAASHGASATRRHRPSAWLSSSLDRIFPALQLLALALALGGCASLPDVRDLAQQLDPDPVPTVATANGELPPDKAESLLAKRLHGAKKTDLKQLAALEEAATGSPLIAGNKVTLLFDGPRTLQAMTEAIEGAQDHINLESYIFDDDEVGKKFADLLIAKQRAGVQVNIIYDSIGSLDTAKEFFGRLRAAGIRLTEFNPVNPVRNPGHWNLNNRDHRKILVVDGRIGFTGGINISADYSHSSLFRSGSGRRRGQQLGWRDTHIRIEGPAVAELQLLFMSNWASQNQEALPDLDYFPPLKPAGDKVLRVIASKPHGNFAIYKAFVLALQQAQSAIHITNAYFAPDVQLLDALKAAAARGVDVKIIFPGKSDVGLSYYAGRSFYAELLRAGIHVYELQGSVLHAKTSVIDSVWSTVGSANLDMRSFLLNNEVTVVVLDAEFGMNMEAAFREDLSHSREVLLPEWEQRGVLERLKESGARSIDYFL